VVAEATGAPPPQPGSPAGEAAWAAAGLGQRLQVSELDHTASNRAMEMLDALDGRRPAATMLVAVGESAIKCLSLLNVLKDT
jgi:hypothetical protein